MAKMKFLSQHPIHDPPPPALKMKKNPYPPSENNRYQYMT